MKSILIYSTLTGNTKKVAESIKEVMPENTDFISIDEAKNIENFDDYDFITIGYWVDRGTADKKTLEVLKNIKNKKIAFFFTLGAYPDSEHAQKCVDRFEELMKNNNNEVLGHFHCQGKIDPRLAEKFKNLPPDHPHAMNEERKKRHAEAAKHPNDEDFQKAKDTFSKILSNI
ncbi:flavodoxin family protein [Oceanotoga teriensis]|jgi:flavodoxin|uniref:Flavodoxin n=1 Tax=Oceanotoga teriensis TaxID=515440 RepID=A0AA45HIJ4_9BACT|nr:flavodoxin family protein [Oceanotoga teriensis]MDO7976050.1 flavodoxin family protein [Oceanotoga teriensis]PWJ92095.1 flavodoxin [Oceanotoga teriensis]